MTAAITLLEMRNRVRSLANMEVASGGPSFVSDTEINQWINDGCKVLYDKLVHARGEDYFCKETAPIPLVNGTTMYSLPADMMSVLEVVCTNNVNGTGNSYPVKRFQRGETADALNTNTMGFSTVPTGLGYRFRLGPNYIEFRPTPVGNGWYFIIYYVPAFTSLSGDSSTFDGINGWEEFPVLWAAIRCLTKEESDTSGLAAQLKLIDANIGKMAPHRDASQTRRVNDTRQDNAGLWTRKLRGQW